MADEKLPTFTAEDVATHNTRDDIWFAVHGKVYDVTDFLDEHPGGEEVRMRRTWPRMQVLRLIVIIISRESEAWSHEPMTRRAGRPI